MRNFLSLQSQLLFLFGAITVYTLSYAPFVRYQAEANDPSAGSLYYRTPTIYRPVEWLTLKTSQNQSMSPLLLWAQLWHARSAVELQTFYFAQQIEDPADKYHYNF